MSSPLKLTKVTNMKRGLEFVETAVENQLMDMEDIHAGMKVENILCIQNLQRYTTHHPHTLSPSTDISTMMGDVFAAITHINREVKNLASVIDKQASDRAARSKHKTKTDPKPSETPKDTLEERIASLENNLRCLRETLTYEENGDASSSK